MRNFINKRYFFLIPILFLLISCAGFVKKDGVRTGKVPAWVNSVESSFNSNTYFAASGFGDSRIKAENNAMAALVSYFGQTIMIERHSAVSYQQAVVNGVMDSLVNTAELRTNIRSTASMDKLMGAEIKEVWFDSIDTYYAVAVLDKAKSIKIYNDLLNANLDIINNFVQMTPNERNSLSGVLRYQFAAVAADLNVSYRNIIVLLGSQVESDIRTGDFYRLQAQNIIRTIPIGIRVTNDRNGRLFGAFARIFSDWGFEAASVTAGNTNLRYILNVNIALSPVDLPANPNIFSRIEVDANLSDSRDGLVLLPYNFNSREGHTTRLEAENRCFSVAERDINSTFASVLSDYFTQLLPKS